MDASERPGHWPPILAREIDALADAVPSLGGGARVLWRSPRPFSAAARVQTAGGEFFVKRHDARVRDPAALLQEHRFIDFLSTQGIAVPSLVKDRDGSTAIVCGAWTYEVHRPAPGVDAYRDAHSWTPARSAAHAHALGRALAQLHLAARGFKAPARGALPLVGGFDIVGAPAFADAFDRYCARRPALARFVSRTVGRSAVLAALEPWHEALRPLLSELEPLWVHNDWHASNLFWTDHSVDAQVCGVIDFGLCNLGCAVADLATALERNAVAWLEYRAGATGGSAIGREPLALAMVAGYAAVRSFSPAERQALPLLMALAHVEFALSEADYFIGIVGDEDDARLACPGFLLGHAHWFEERHGRSFLAALRGALGAGPGAR